MLEPRTQLLRLGLSDSEVTVYMAMLSGVHTARNLVKVTRLKRPTVYYVLGCLEKRGLVSKTGRDGDGLVVEPAGKLAVIAKERSLEALQQQADIEALVPILTATMSTPSQKPTVAFFEGAGAVRSAIMETLYGKSKQIDSIIPAQNFFWQTGADFVELFVTERTSRKIKTRNLWETPASKAVMRRYYEGLSQVRILPSIMHGKFQTSIFVYGDTTLYVASKSASYCVRITSKDHTDAVRAMFDGIWSTAVPHET